MLHELNMVARHEELYYEKPPEADEDAFAIMDPDKFPITKLTNDLIKEYQSVWETKRGSKMLK